MFVYYAFLILLPAAALAAKCDEALLNEFFRVLDTDRSLNVSKAEVSNLVKALDVNGNDELTLEEVKTRSRSVAPTLVGREEQIFVLLDLDADGKITRLEITIEFFIIDSNYDGFKDTKEWKRFVKYICPLLPLVPKIKYTCPTWLPCGNK